MAKQGKSEGAKTSFPLTAKRQPGYDMAAVDDFLNRAKATFEGEATGGEAVTSAQLRTASFPLRKKKGYDPRYVDAALDRLEEVFFERERRAFVRARGQEAWDAHLDSLEKDIVGRLRRPQSERFNRRGWLAHGYRRSQVDAVLDQISTALASELRVKSSDVRGLKFHLQRGGYDEAQVDAFLDSVVEYLLARR